MHEKLKIIESQYDNVIVVDTHSLFNLRKEAIFRDDTHFCDFAHDLITDHWLKTWINRIKPTL